MSDKHTPVPWDYYNAWQGGEIAIIHPAGDPDDFMVCKLTDEAGEHASPEGNARFIVTACNHHAELVEVLRETTKWADQFAKQMEMYDVSEEAKEAVSDARTLMAKLEADQ